MVQLGAHQDDNQGFVKSVIQPRRCEMRNTSMIDHSDLEQGM